MIGESVIFLKSILVGLGIAVPMGPVGVLCVRRTLTHGPLLGLTSGLGAAFADCLYGAVAAFGLAAVENWIVDHGEWFRLLGGLFLIVLGFWNMAKGPNERRGYEGSSNLLWAFCSTFALTLANPVTLLAFAAIFAALGLAGSVTSSLDATVLVSGVFVGASVWWIGLAGVVLALRRHVTPSWMKRIHYGSAMIVIAFGCYAVGSYFFGDPLAGETFQAGTAVGS